METRPVKYIAQVEGVRELALLGAAELSWWRDHLAGEELEPVEVDGRAQVLVTGMDAKWMGIPFRELAVIVAAPAPNVGFVAVAAGNTHNLGLKADGSIRAWGWNQYRQCDVPAPNMYYVAVAAGQRHSLAIKNDGRTDGWIVAGN